MRILVTGGCGFIGSHFIRHLLNKYPAYSLINLDALTYAGNRENLKDIEGKKSYTFVKGKIEDAALLKELARDVDAVVHFAAESHVDRSITDAQPFLSTNVIGTYILMEAAKDAGVKKFVHISTDEVYGALGEKGKFTEDTPLRPNSPYSASKASADMLVRAYHETFGFPSLIVRPSNNYGPYQYPEKFIPLMITNLFEGRPVPVYGEGKNVRDWLFVEDNCRAIDLILHEGKIGEAYNVGGNAERRNIDIVRKVMEIMGKDESLITFVKDRPGHDYRYALDTSKIERELGWKPSVDIDNGLIKTVQWYRDNEWWWRPLKERLSSESKGFWEKNK
ncbi:MAG: dTDP-glucose 4,6-dehydratase [Nitrospirae bacterium]|nr:dTDP-glucose 4,6-dehydratase [Nitrospirota bacterium]MCL5422758.1 dTDP-glucose 4,6-dehydratase [Nitrospirota bacterium]